MSFEVMTVIAELRFRCLVPEDLPQVRLLDDAAYEWDAWRPEQWDELLRLTNISGKVLVDLRGVILGFMVYVLHMDRVTPDLLPFLIDLAEKLRAETIADWTKEQQRAKRVRKSRRAA